MRPSKRDGFFLLLGVMIGVLVLAPASAFAQTAGGLGTSAVVGTSQIDTVSAGAVVKFIVDLVKRGWSGEKQAPSILPILALAVVGPLVVAIMLMRDRVNLTDPAIIAGTFFTGLFVAGATATLLTAAHDEARKPEYNIPPALANVPTVQRAQLCCLHGDCRTVQMASTQAMSGQPAVPVEAAQPVPTSPPEPPPPDPPTRPTPPLKG